jgi:hypothetical protein
MEFRALWSQSRFQRFFLLLIFKNEKWTFYFCPFLKILFENLKNNSIHSLLFWHFFVIKWHFFVIIFKHRNNYGYYIL